MKYYNLLFNNQSKDFENKKHGVLRETEHFIWLKSNNNNDVLKVSKRTNRVWVIKKDYSFESAKCKILEAV